MSNSKISALTAATTPLVGTETLPIVQSSATVKATISNIQTAPVSSGTANAIVYLDGSKVPTTGTVLYFNGTNFGVGTTSPTEKFTVSGNAAISGTGYFSFERNLTPAAAGSGTPSVQFRMVTTGTTYVAGSAIDMLSDGAWSATSAPGIIRFRTTPSGSTTLVDRGRFDSAGGFCIGTTTSPGLGGLITTNNIIQGTAAKGFDFSANTPLAGKTSTILNWYEEGTWTPNQGAGLTLVGAFSSTGRYTRIGRQVSISGTVTGATSVAVTAAGVITSNLPFTVGTAGHGDATNAAVTASATVICTGTSVTAASAVAATGTITFSATYFV